jgi:GNAT superfamily N-acetyltransferase
VWDSGAAPPDLRSQPPKLSAMIRRGGQQDVPFMRDMLRHAYYWRWADPELDDLPVGRYVDRWGREGDTALVLIERFQPVGAAWYRLFKAPEPGYGFIDEHTPELTIAVVPSCRGKGHGAELLTALLDRARADGYDRISLSVEADSPAVKLYERHGFEAVAHRGEACVMVAELTPSAA